MGPVGVGLPRCDRVWAAVESFFDPIQLCKRSFPVSVLHEFWVTGQYNSDTSNFQLFIAIFTRVGMEPFYPRLFTFLEKVITLHLFHFGPDRA